MTGVLALTFFLLFLSGSHSRGQTFLFQDDFGSGNANRWQVEPGWQVEDDGGNLVLSGSGHSFARAGSLYWSNYSFKTRVKLMDAGSGVHLNYRSQGCDRYYVGFNSGGLYLSKTFPCPAWTELTSVAETYNSNQWYAVEIIGDSGNIKVYVDGSLKIDYTDSSPLLNGSISFEVLDNSHVHFDDVFVTTDEPLSQTPWVNTGGPLGGLGYDVRIHPANKSIMYVTDNFAGVARSDNSGQTWYQTNTGITVKGGATGDAVNIFSLTIDPNNPAILWAGTNGEGASFGVFKSTDGGASWVPKTAGMALSGDIGMVFRGFTIQQGNSNVVYAQAEIPTTVHGWEFNRVKGRVYKTTNGGETWSLIWQGDDLARYLIIDPGNPDILYLSAGIFDREAYNSDCAQDLSGGVGVLKSTDGGQTWDPVNDGLTDLYVGSLRMHPTNSQILFAATGNNACSGGYTGNLVSGLFKTTNGGASWTKVITNDIMTTVNFSPSLPDTIYAGSGSAFYRSQNGGTTWTRFSQLSGTEWGPSGIRAGIPIDVTVDPDDPSALYANNYGGGVFRSADGAATWQMWSKGYSGADIHEVHVPAGNPSRVYAIGRSGPFTSFNYGGDWVGIANGDATYAEWNSITTRPANSSVILVSDEHQGVIFHSSDGGNHFTEVLRHPDTQASDPNKRQGFRGLVFAPSNPNLVYAGLSKDRGAFLSSSPVGTVIYKSQDGGMTFSPMASILDGNNVRRLIVDPNDANKVYAATTNGVYQSGDGAASWTRMDSLGSRQIEALAIDPQQPGYILAGEVFGGIWISANGGTSWTGPHNSGFNSANPYISSLVIDSANPDIMFAGDLYSGIYRSSDKGNTWAPFPDWKMSGLTIRAVKGLAINDNALYAATQGGGVFRFDRVARERLTVMKTGAGSVSSTPGGIDCGSLCDNEFTSGAPVELTASPAAGSVFSGWTGACLGSTNPCTVTMDASKSVTATFPLITYGLTLNKTGSGTVTSNPAGIDCGGDCSQDYDGNTVVTLTATPDAGALFAGWSGAPDCSDGVVTMDGNKTCTAMFEPDPVPLFEDVTAGYWAYDFVMALYNAGITGGCSTNPLRFCPDSTINRWQMAVFMETSLGRAPAAECTGVFSDVNTETVGDAVCRFIEDFASAGITGGCGSGKFCPNDPVTRAQMAVFIEAALGASPAPSCAGMFSDVNAETTGDGFCRFIEDFATRGITGGCGGGNYCPNNSVTRAQMAIFLVTAPAPLNP
jgi:photosystem II stability/assembly factor-like uncharacterized protein